jgi:thiosulfate dehydrogenase
VEALMKFVLGLIVGIVLVPVVLYLYFWSGMAPAATSAAPMPFEKAIARMSLRARIKKEMPPAPAAAPTDANYMSGAMTYKMECAVCHGSPGQQPSNAAKGMFPKPPQLFNGHGVTDDPVGETYWKVANGIRLTGMPGFKGNLTDQEIWNVSFMLTNADKLPQPVKDALK